VSGNSEKPLRSGDLAKLVGVSSDTLRLYERRGLLPRPPRAANGYRCYPPGTVGRVRLIRAALSIGFTLEELREILRLRDGQGVPCAHVRKLAGTKLRNLDQHIAQLAELRDQHQSVLKQWDPRLKKSRCAQRDGSMEALAATSGSKLSKLGPQLYASLAGKSIH
jgi:DNA-binding transcriptional MerR regulator